MIVLEEIAFSHRETRTRFPFRYGIASMTELPHVFVRVRLRVGDHSGEGLASEGLAPKWFTKNPATTFSEDLPDLLRVLQTAASHGLTIPAQPDVFTWWRQLYSAQSAWAIAENLPPLLAHLGTSLVERAALDAYCRLQGLTIAEAFSRDALGFRVEQIHAHLPAEAQRAFLEPGPAGTVTVRHTVGLGDPLTAADLSETQPLADGLPYTLEEIIPRYGLTWFKIKLSGREDEDLDRLGTLARLLPRLSPDYRVTLDGNEQFGDVDTFRDAWERMSANPALAELLGRDRVHVVEQPLHRDKALGDEVGAALRAWPERPPLIIDESDCEVGTVSQALQLGYAGSSHKNCKGVFKGVANGIMLANRSGAVQTGEDLANIGPVALLQDLAIMALLRIPDVERNGHHYFRGLSPFPAELGEAVLAAHPDLYETLPDGTATLKIRGGLIELGSVLQAPFGQSLAPGRILELAGVRQGLPSPQIPCDRS